jgi:phosphoglycolate phosphatase
MDGRPYRAVLFDLDGTLVDSYTALTTAVNHARATQLLPPIARSDLRDLVGEGVERLLEKVLETTQVPREALDAFEERYGEVCCVESRVLAEVTATVEHLHQRGIAMAVCTNKPTGFSVKIVEHLGLAPFFRSVIGPDAAGTRKPDPRHLLHALSTVSCEPREALFVGDMPIDIAAARNSGIDVAAIASGSATRRQLLAAAPDFLIDSFSDLLRLVWAENREPHR